MESLNNNELREVVYLKQRHRDFLEMIDQIGVDRSLVSQPVMIQVYQAGDRLLGNVPDKEGRYRYQEVEILKHRTGGNEYAVMRCSDEKLLWCDEFKPIDPVAVLHERQAEALYNHYIACYKQAGGEMLCQEWASLNDILKDTYMLLITNGVTIMKKTGGGDPE